MSSHVDRATPAEVRAALSAAHRAEWGAVFGAMVRFTGDWTLAEDCTQDAFVRALDAWPRTGIPERTGAWLLTTARNRAVDVLRRRSTERDRFAELATRQRVEGLGGDADHDDERLSLLFTCCHPALPMPGRVALTLRAVCGLTTREIARAFLIDEATVSQRILRAKRKIAEAAIPYRVPPPGMRGDRLAGVLAVIYLVFTEGYAPTGPRTVRDDLTAEAIRLARLVHAECPDEPEAAALLALMLLQHGRRPARVDDDGHLVRLEEQDRSLWDAAMIGEGAHLARAALPTGGRYALEAAIATEHSLAPTAQSTRWAVIVELYDRLLSLGDNPVVALNRTVALGMRDGPRAALTALDVLGVPRELAGNHAVDAVRADSLRRLGLTAEAVTHYRRARELAPSAAVAREYDRRLAELGAARSSAVVCEREER